MYTIKLGFPDYRLCDRKSQVNLDLSGYDMTVSNMAPNETTTSKGQSSTDIENIESLDEPQDSNVDTVVNANATLKVVTAYVVNDDLTTITAANETKFYQWQSKSKVKIILFSSITLIIGGIIYIILFLCGVNHGSVQVNRREHVRMIAIEVSGEDAFQVDDSPQSIALKWMQEQDQLIIPISEKSLLIQRYVSSLLYFSLGGPFWYDQSSFINGTLHECEWNEWEGPEEKYITRGIYSRGFHCRDRKKISDLQFYHSNVTGSIPKEIATLSELVTINLGGNHNLIGTIPGEIGLLKELNFLYLFSNSLYGNIPKEIENASKLNAVIMYGNINLTDNMDPFCAIPNLRYMQVDCGNGTSKAVCECCTACCNPEIEQCCTLETSSCFTTKVDEGWF